MTIAKTFALAVGLTVFLPGETENAIANGDTRTINLYHAHTRESISATFRRDGVYDQATLDKLNWFLRDWRTDEPTKMDPRLFDVVWEAYRESGSSQPVEIVSAYRAPATNAMLRRRSRAVAEHSQHMLGKAMDMHYMDVPMSRIRDIGMRMQRGGVGYYPTSGTPFVHLDVGSVRYWPRMNYDQLARLFPDGKTVFLPSNGRPLARYQEARAEIESRGQGYETAASITPRKGLLASLFGLGEDEEGDIQASRAPAGKARGGSQVASLGRATGIGPASRAAPVQMAAADTESSADFFSRSAQPAPASPVVRAQQDLPKGETFLSAAPAQPAAKVLPLPAPQVAPDVIATDKPVPLPPRRPADLAPVVVAALSPPVIPEPPLRPTDLPAPPKSDRIANLIAAEPQTLYGRSTGLPPVITQGTSVDRNTVTAPGALAYAAPDTVARPGQPLVQRPSTGPVLRNGPIGLRTVVAQRRSMLVAARLDRSNFRSMTSPVDIPHMAVQSTFGSSVQPIRAAARLDLVAVAFAPTLNAGLSATDEHRDLPTDHFAAEAWRSYASAPATTLSR